MYLQYSHVPLHTHTGTRTRIHTHYTTKALSFPPHTELKFSNVFLEWGIRKVQLVYGWNEIG